MTPSRLFTAPCKSGRSTESRRRFSNVSNRALFTERTGTGTANGCAVCDGRTDRRCRRRKARRMRLTFMWLSPSALCHQARELRHLSAWIWALARPRRPLALVNHYRPHHPQGLGQRRFLSFCPSIKWQSEAGSQPRTAAAPVPRPRWAGAPIASPSRDRKISRADRDQPAASFSPPREVPGLTRLAGSAPAARWALGCPACAA